MLQLKEFISYSFLQNEPLQRIKLRIAGKRANNTLDLKITPVLFDSERSVWTEVDTQSESSWREALKLSTHDDHLIVRAVTEKKKNSNWILLWA